MSPILLVGEQIFPLRVLIPYNHQVVESPMTNQFNGISSY